MTDKNENYYRFRKLAPPKEGHAEYTEAMELGPPLSRRRVFAVCTGGYGGVMEGRCRAGAREAGGGAFLAVTSSFFFPAACQSLGWMRKLPWRRGRSGCSKLVRLGDGYVACKGGTGTTGGTRRGLGNAQ